MNTLQSVVLPNLDVPGDQALYVRTNDRAFCELGQPRLRFLDGGDAWTDTFYGGLTVAAWKRTSPVERLFLELGGEGRFLAGIGLYRLGQALQWLDEREVQLEAGTPLRMPVEGWGRATDGMLFLRLRALAPGTLEYARYCTDEAPRRDVKLGIVVTHFNRPAQVLPAVKRMRRQVLRNPEVAGRITLTVVDNSRNLTLAEGDGVHHIPNRNYGGSGGFARGLLSLEQDGSYTHGLFMDDDASCEAESVLRTYALLRYATSPRLAIAGALASESEPWHLLEKGAVFDGKCRALHPGLDLRHVPHLLQAERHTERPDYGGWWFFAYPIRELRQYPFPFFVRGDDVFFSLAHEFEILTLNGIACLGEEFRVKHGPLTAYLDSRYHLLHLALQDHGRERLLRRLVSNQFFKPLMAYQYASARAFTLALQHVTQGPRFFRENLDLAKVRGEIGAWTPSEKLQPIDIRGMKLRRPSEKKERPLTRLARVLTLQGFLLPKALLRDRVLHHDKAFHGKDSAVFRYRKVLYEHWQSGTGYVAEHDRGLFFRELRDMLRALREFRRALPRLSREYSDAVPTMASKAFWMELYGLRPSAGAQPRPEPETPAHARPDRRVPEPQRRSSEAH